jgi:drug/metabolite transporter (DMT)-like permease
MSQVDATRLRDTLLVVPLLLAGLWVTGLAIAAIDTHLSWVEFVAKPKLQAKFVCLCVLTANGWALHHKVFKRLANPRRIDAKTALVFGGLGAISTSSWLFAAFLGVARSLERHASFPEFIGLYAALLGMALLGCLLLSKLVITRVRIAQIRVSSSTSPRR